MQHDAVDIARACYLANADEDRAALEVVIAEDFHFARYWVGPP